MPTPKQLLPWLLLINALLLALIAARYVTLRDAWRAYEMAEGRAHQLLATDPT